MDDQITKVKALNKINKKGKVVRVIREHYLREDIWCKSLACSSCDHQDAILEAPEMQVKMSSSQKKKLKKVSGRTIYINLFPQLQKQSAVIPQSDYKLHYLVPSVEVTLKYIDIFEECGFLKNIIFCETVMEEASQHPQRKLYNRIR